MVRRWQCSRPALKPMARGLLCVVALLGCSVPVSAQLIDTVPDAAGTRGGDGWFGGANAGARDFVIENNAESPGQFDADVDLRFQADDILAVNLSRASLARAVRIGVRPVRKTRLETIGMVLWRLRVPPSMSASAALTMLAQVDTAGSYSANQLYRLADGGASLSCEGLRCFARSLMQWPEAGCPIDLPIGVVDGGSLAGAPWLARESVVYQRIAPPSLPAAEQGHALAVASLIAGQADSSFPGLAPQAPLSVADVFWLDEQQQPVTDAATLVEGLEWVAARGARVINVSVAGPHAEVLELAVRRLLAKQVYVVAAVGNAGAQAPPSYPAAYPTALAATAVDHYKRVYPQAGQGSHVSFAVPGVNLWVATVDGGGRFASGTSYAVAMLSVSVAARLAQPGNQRPQQVLGALRDQAEDLGEPGHDAVFGWGLARTPNCNANTAE